MSGQTLPVILIFNRLVFYLFELDLLYLYYALLKRHIMSLCKKTKFSFRVSIFRLKSQFATLKNQE